jgi:hypothetical protein
MNSSPLRTHSAPSQMTILASARLYSPKLPARPRYHHRNPFSAPSSVSQMMIPQDKPKSRLEAPPTQCPRCKTHMKVRKCIPLPSRKFVDWTTAATNAEQRFCEPCHAGARVAYEMSSSTSGARPPRSRRGPRFLRWKPRPAHGATCAWLKSRRWT